MEVMLTTGPATGTHSPPSELLLVSVLVERLPLALRAIRRPSGSSSTSATQQELGICARGGLGWGGVGWVGVGWGGVRVSKAHLATCRIARFAAAWPRSPW
jgi:hypothetical protein